MRKIHEDLSLLPANIIKKMRMIMAVNTIMRTIILQRDGNREKKVSKVSSM